jgi:hypothetical protein
MRDQIPPNASPGESAFSLALMLIAAAVAFTAGIANSTLPYWVAGFGFLVLAPLWYRSPVSLKALRAPLGERLTHKRTFTTLDVLLTSIGYGLVLFAIGLLVFG